jgi:hypothetical protein
MLAMETPLGFLPCFIGRIAQSYLLKILVANSRVLYSHPDLFI